MPIEKPKTNVVHVDFRPESRKEKDVLIIDEDTPKWKREIFAELERAGFLTAEKGEEK